MPSKRNDGGPADMDMGALKGKRGSTKPKVQAKKCTKARREMEKDAKEREDKDKESKTFKKTRKFCLW